MVKSVSKFSNSSCPTCKEANGLGGSYVVKDFNFRPYKESFFFGFL